MVEKVVDFILSNSTYTDRDIIRECVEGHTRYKSCFIACDGDRVIGFIRWNQADLESIVVCDCIIDKDYRGKGVLDELIWRMKVVLPSVTKVSFERGYDSGLEKKPLKTYTTDQIIRRMKKCLAYS